MRKGVIVGMDGRPLASGAVYEAATASPRGSGWSAPNVGPNAAVASSGKVLRDRTRAQYRNSPLLRSAINKGVTAEAGKGVSLLSICKNEAVRDVLNELWKETCNQLDPWGDMSFGGLIDQIVRARRMSGEVFVVRVPVRLGMGLKVPLQVSVLESDFCPITLTKRLTNGNRIVQGIELKGRKKVAFWFYQSHPTDWDNGSKGTSTALIRIPARDVIHHYKALRPGQLRGEPDTAAALLKDKTFSDYSDAELQRKQTRAGFTGFLYREDFEEDDYQFDPVTGRAIYDDSEAPQEREVVAGGTILRGQAGEKLQLFEGDNTGSGFNDFVKWQAQQLAAALEIPYPLLTGDWAGLSDRTIRAILNEFRRGVTADQTNLLGFQVCLKVWQWFVNTAVTVGLVPAAGFAENPWAFYALDIRPDAWRHLHPEQDIRSRTMAINSNLSNLEREAAECGGDLTENMRANARSRALWEKVCQEEGLDPSQHPMPGTTSNNKPKALEGLSDDDE
ncbi:MAG: phage portal protein [Aeromonas veronii]